MPKRNNSRVRDYLNLFPEMADSALFSQACVEAMASLRDSCGDANARQLIFEVDLTGDSLMTDVSFRVDTEEAGERLPLVENKWLEFDYERYAGSAEPEPCVFYDASAMSSEEGREAFLGEALPALLGEDRTAALRPNFERLCNLPEIQGLFQVGSMDARGRSESARIYTLPICGGEVCAVLRALNWSGDIAKIGAYTNLWAKLAHRGSFTLSFDLFSDHISDKIGLEFIPKGKHPKAMDAILRYLVSEGYARPEKAQAVSRWVRELPLGEPQIQNDVSHIKFKLEKDTVTLVKAYLRMSDGMAFPWFPMYRTPRQINLELTTKCPLHCPQCYVHLNTGEELPKEEAIYWIREAARAGVKSINLSGGETLCYPWLDELIKECHDLGLRSNIALSGAYLTPERLEKLMDAGVDYIYISLNGSTKEVNARTRDGYDLAIRALGLLKEHRFPNTVINFVMHRSNAGDLSNMLCLAEEYGVSELAVMGFKPDSSGALEGYPTAAQLRETAEIIQNYHGPVTVYAEGCFSPLRALIGERALLNTNVGIEKGCGAGRHIVSIDVHGKITPCRHLSIPEDYRSISDYWEKSTVLAELREIENRREEPCAACRFSSACLLCAAVGYVLHGELLSSMPECPLANTRRSPA